MVGGESAAGGARSSAHAIASLISFRSSAYTGPKFGDLFFASDLFVLVSAFWSAAMMRSLIRCVSGIGYLRCLPAGAGFGGLARRRVQWKGLLMVCGVSRVRRWM